MKFRLIRSSRCKNFSLKQASDLIGGSGPPGPSHWIRRGKVSFVLKPFLPENHISKKNRTKDHILYWKTCYYQDTNFVSQKEKKNNSRLPVTQTSCLLEAIFISLLIILPSITRTPVTGNSNFFLFPFKTSIKVSTHDCLQLSSRGNLVRRARSHRGGSRGNSFLSLRFTHSWKWRTGQPERNRADHWNDHESNQISLLENKFL